ncbi:MAG: hypothetical protein JWQ96_2844 [Segetibacter sp.]|nr:hypothetical protein [Segetibacter sp.]
MQKTIYILLIVGLFATACGGSKKEKTVELTEKKSRLEKLKSDQQKIADEIAKLQKEILLQDPASRVEGNAKLVTIAPVAPENFTHYVDLQGRIDATNISYVAPPNGQGGVVKQLYVKQGDNVRKGQVLARLDATMINQQVEPLRVQLATAEDTYKRTKNLWDQGIGTYQQVLTAQTQVETLRKNIGIIQRQAGLMTVKAPTSGVADVVNVRVGEMFTGTGVGGPQIRIVNTGRLKVVAEVPENYLGRIGQGSNLVVTLPNLNKKFNVKVNVAGKIIDPARRTFYVEAPIPSSPDLKPNQIATVQVQDYTKSAAVTIPVNALQNDDKGKFVMVAVNEKGKLIARKRYVVVGELYGDKLEVRSGLEPTEQLILEGFQNLYDGQLIITA